MAAQMAMTSTWSKCSSSRQGSDCQSTSASASPLSGTPVLSRRSDHRLWADISDGEDDSMSEWGEDRMLPTTFDNVSESDTSERHTATPQKLEDVHAELQAPTTKLNVYAPEFLPTLSMSVPLVGIYDVIVEGDEAELQDSENFRFASSHYLVPLQQRHRTSSDGSKAGMSSASKFWRKPKSLEARQPRVQQGVPAGESISQEQLQRRIRSVQVGMETKEYQFHLAKASSGRPGNELPTPDVHDASIGRRQWNHVVKHWREELERLYLLETEGLSLEGRPEAASVASTEAEETQTSEVDDSTTVTSDDASSTHWF